MQSTFWLFFWLCKYVFRLPSNCVCFLLMANLVFQAIMQYANLRKNRLPLFMVHGVHTFLYFRSEIKEQTSKERKHMLSQVYTETFADIWNFWFGNDHVFNYIKRWIEYELISYLLADNKIFYIKMRRISKTHTLMVFHKTNLNFIFWSKWFQLS